MTLQGNNTTHTFAVTNRDSAKQGLKEQIERTLSITSPCCNASLFIVTEHEGGFFSSDIPSEILCNLCGNSWGPDGKPS